MSEWFILVGFALVATYEIMAAVRTDKPTISEYVWRGIGAFPQLSFLVGLGVGLLLGHLFL